MAVIRRLNYQHLLYFWSVVRTGSLTRACEELALSAPTVSSQLRTLEERLGEKLLANRAAISFPRKWASWSTAMPTRFSHGAGTARRAGAAPIDPTVAPAGRHRRRSAERDLCIGSSSPPCN